MRKVYFARWADERSFGRRGDGAFASHLAECIRFYEDYQKTAVPDLSIARGHADPAANPGLRADHTWGPFTGSALCKW